MDSITHALYKAVAAADAVQRIDAREASAPRTVLGAAVPGDHGGGLQPLATRPEVFREYEDAAGTDLHIELAGGTDLMAFWLELTTAGLGAPVGMIQEGAEVILRPGQVRLYVENDNGRGTWIAVLKRGTDSRRSEWYEEKA